jgi:PTS system N-acetylglucosamine-specific IIC component
MYTTARPERRRAVGGLLLSMGLTSFLTGVTEPIEFSFMFLAPLLYAVHAVLTGTAMVLMHWLDVRLGFGFSAGLFDYVLNFRLAEKPLWLLPVGAGYFALYFALFRYAILRFDLRTPGREAEAPVAADAVAGAEAVAAVGSDDFVTALGGPGNLRSIDACTTRLRLEVLSQDAVDEAALRRLGAHGLVRPSATALQVVIGPTADQVAERIRQQLRGMASPSVSKPAAISRTTTVEPTGPATIGGSPTPAGMRSDEKTAIRDVLAALGGRHNVVEVEAASTRLLIRVRNDPVVDERNLRRAAPRGSVHAALQTWHVIVGPSSDAWARELRALCEISAASTA